MNSVKHAFNKLILNLKKFLSGGRQNLVIGSALAIAMILLSFAVKYTANYVAVSQNDTKSVQSWEYCYLKNADAKPNTDELSQSSYVLPISTKGNTGYYYLRHTFEKVSDDTYLTVKTDRSPLKILVNGEEVYNNHYGTDSYTGNSYNCVKLTKTALSQTVEVYMAVPYSMCFEVSTSTKAPSTFPVNQGMVFAIIMLAVGVIILLISLAFSIKNKHFSPILFIAFYNILSGVSVGLWEFLQSSYTLNAPIYANISQALSLAGIVIAEIMAFNAFGSLKKSAKFTTALSFVAALCSLIPNVSIVTRIVPLACSALLLVSLGLSQSAFLQAMGRRAKGSFSVWFAINFVVLSSVILSLQMFFGNVKYFILFNFMTDAVFTVVMTAVGFDKSSLKYKKKQEEYEKFIKDTSWVDALNKIVDEIVGISDDSEKIVVAAKELKDLLNSQLPEDGQLTVGVCIGNSEAGGFNQIYSDNIDEECNYDLINYRYANYSELNNVFWGDTYFDIVLKKFDAIHSIIHFEGSKEMLDDKISNVIEVLCAQLTLLINVTGDEQKDEDFQVDFLSKLAEVVETKSGSGKNHLTNVSAISLCICSELGFGEDDIRRIGFASALHDIGKIIIPESILENQGALSDDEKNIIKTHAEFGGKLLSGVPGEFVSVATQIAHYHHERIDGNGYYGLKGEEIPLAARITTVADVFDALTSVRSYKNAWTDERAISYLKEYSGTIFDPKVVDAFIKSYDLICELKKGGEA